MTVFEKVGWVHVVDRNILLTRNQGLDVFYLPGGGKEPGETDLETLVREAAEELTVTIRPETVRPFETFLVPRPDAPDGELLRLICMTADYDGTLLPDNEIAELAWMTQRDRDRISTPTMHVFDALIARDLLAP